ncbi:MAG: zinc-dependent alcohol dehydrogenase family protein [Candidatus Obscuribacterales bacterium]|nr:zinc-dependent alcohol dehydrogenase family protein [Candidatus Obscuribacterales bacterium]
MRAMVMDELGKGLVLKNLPVPQPAAGQVQIAVKACAVCRTDLHVVDGDLKNPKLPIIPGHEIVGVITEVGSGVEKSAIGKRVGVPWLGKTCGYCRFCVSGQENLCDDARFTGYQIDGGYAEFTVADTSSVILLPDELDDVQIAPWLCAGLIGWRSLKMAGEGENLGLYGFGASAHIVIQIAKYQNRRVFVFTRPDDLAGQAFAMRMGAHWAGSSSEPPAHELDAAIIFAPVGSLVVSALKAVRKGGTVVTAGIHMSDIPQFPYEILWGERVLRSVANLTHRDAQEFIDLAPKIPIETTTKIYSLEDANVALDDLRNGRLEGAAVLKMS